MRFLLVDFDDSFTLNIASMIRSCFASQLVDVVHWQDSKATTWDSYSLVILGPGPGIPEQYGALSDYISRRLLDQKQPILGICLGHQILGNHLGLTLVPCKTPVHGQPRTYSLDPYFSKKMGVPHLTIQHYNSWTLKESEGVPFHTLALDGEIQLLSGRHFFGFQGHPESVGTVSAQVFMKPLIEGLLCV